METTKTSFGEMAKILVIDGQVKAEFLRFERSGRAHKHGVFESFFVISGKGKVVSGETTYPVEPGSLVTIPPQTDHWMEPENGVMEGMLWYHEEPLNLAKEKR